MSTSTPQSPTHFPEAGDPSRLAATTRPEPVDQLAQGTHHKVDALADKAAAGVRDIQDKLAHASDALHERTRQWRGALEEWVACARITVRENPLQAVGTALAVGALVGLLCSRR